MGTIFDFKPRQPKEPPKPCAAPASQEKAEQIASQLPMLDEGTVDVLQQQSAAMQVIAALSFYARQGWDGGLKARRAMVAMQEIMQGHTPPVTST